MSFYLLAGGVEALEAVRSLVPANGGPDLYERVYTQFGIDNARELVERAMVRPLQAPFRTFIIVAAVITTEAQNALLKTIEEPPAGAHFYFIVPNPDALLPTVLSRAQKVSGTFSAKTIAKQFLAAQPKDRLDLLKPLLEKNNEDTRDIGAILAFLAELESQVGAKEDLHAVYRARKYITDKGALTKPLLESVALLV